MSSKEPEEEFAICVDCANPIEKCVCVCPFCGERDKCECALFDAATGGKKNQEIQSFTNKKIT